MLTHLFELTAEGRQLVQFSEKRLSAESAMPTIDELGPTAVDLLALGTAVEQLVTSLRAAHLDGTGPHLLEGVTLHTFARACFFIHETRDIEEARRLVARADWSLLMASKS
jgi:hypothetical protein